MAGLPAPGAPGYGYHNDPGPHTVLVWPDNARVIALYLLLIAVWAVTGWWHLRGNSCWKCGRDNGLCRHTRDTHDSGGTKR